jgi:hypothetical protein
MSRTIRTILFVLLPLSVRAAESADLLTVRLASGRTFAGQVEAGTSRDELRLQFDQGSVSLVRAIDWQRIAAAEHRGVAVPLDELQALAETIKLPPRVRQPLAVSAAETPPAEPATQPQVRAIAFDAVIANWDADVETDGIALRLLPLDGDNRLTPASGTLEVELYAPQRRRYQDAPQSDGYTIGVIGRWSVRVERAAFDDDGLVVRLPFQALHPQFRSDLYWYGLVHAKFSVPGRGVFEQSQDGLKLRPFTPLRDALDVS